MDEWLALIKHRTSVGFKEKCQKFKRMRAGRTLLHRTSRKRSFARLEEELREQSENLDAISRSDIWIHAYDAKKKKSSDEVVEDPEIVKQVKQKRAEQEPSQTSSLKDDAVAQVLGLDPRGRVRGLGFGAVPSKLEYQTKVANKVANLEKQVSTQAQNMLSQSQEIERLKEVVATLLARSEKEGNNHNENPNVQHHSSDGVQCNQNIASVRGSDSGRPQSKQSNQKKTSSIYSIFC
ncbi:putative transposase, Ptta/En/Spm, plant [Rosa chinensis]|uniref:Putative transposase, Ptta/En/Spm, plant n=1 Tax=Rosa chinensis TaxID=74649 RepID=A0A2P6QXY4_ROSCH|nr:putative transposase, Ptta/En/Spm, plant [Rosa chinensis]